MSERSFEIILNRFKGFRFGELALNVINEPFFDKSIIAKIVSLTKKKEHIEKLFFSSNWLMPDDKTLDQFCEAVHQCSEASHIGKIQLNATISGIDQSSYNILQAGAELIDATTPYRLLDFKMAVANVCGLLARLSKSTNCSKVVFMIKAYGDLFTSNQMMGFWQGKFLEWHIPEDFTHQKVKIVLNHGFTSFARSTAILKSYGMNSCHAAWLDKRLVIGPTGDVGLCCEDGLRQIIVGNLIPLSLEEFIRGKSFQEHIKTTLGRSAAPAEHPCLRCRNF